VSRPQACKRLVQLATRRPAHLQVDAALPRELRHKVVLPRAAAQRAQVERGVAEHVVLGGYGGEVVVEDVQLQRLREQLAQHALFGLGLGLGLGLGVA
jgi:hypothetical protein